MKKIYFLLLISLLSSVFLAYSQNAPVTTISSTTASPGTIITLQVTQTNVVSLAGFGLKLNYDATVLSFVDPNPTAQAGNWYNTNSALYSAGGDIAGVQTDLIAGVTKTLTIYWTAFPTAITPANTSGVAIICDLQFRYYGGSTSVVFDNSSNGGQLCEYVDASAISYIDIPSATYYFNGSVSTTSTVLLPPSSATASPATICSGSPTTLGIIGGTLGAGANWNWYSGSCGGTYVISGSSITVNPNITTTYWVRAEDATTTTTCVSVTVYISLSTSAVSAQATPNTINTGMTSTLTVNGGNLASGANWYWYTGTCGGTLIGTGAPLTQTPTSTGLTTYFVRAEGLCNTTYCITAVLYVTTSCVNSISASSITGITALCSGSSTTLGVNGGSLGTVADWYWYMGTCGGTLVGSGATLIQTPTSTNTTTYYLRAEGQCNTTTCISSTVVLYTNSPTPTTVTVSQSPICSGATLTLGVGVSIGSIGSNANWNWYTGSCGGTYVISGVSPLQSPTVTTTYFVRAEGTCNTTSCISITVVVTAGTFSILPLSALSVSPICLGSTTTLGLIGGTLGTGANWNWYTGSCGGTNIGSGASLIQTPTIATIYYLRAEGTCSTTACLSTSVIINTLSPNPTNVTVSQSPICSGTTLTLGVGASTGSLGSNANWNWYTGSCGGTYVISGVSPSQTPTVTTTYYVRAEGICNTTTCISITVVVIPGTLSILPSSVLSVSPVCLGSTTTLGLIGGTLGTGANWNWYTGSCGGTNIGSGASLIQTPTIATIYYLRAEGTCSTTACLSTSIIINTLTPNPTNVTVSQSPICSGTTITLGVGASTGSLGSNANWNWYTGSCGGTYVISGVSPLQSPTVTTTYFVRAEGTCNTTSCISILVTISSASITANFSNIYSGNNTTYFFQDLSTTSSNYPITQWNWSFGDGHSSTLQYPTHQYIASGTYQVCLTVTDSIGCSNTYCNSITVTVTASNCLLYLTYTSIDETTTGANNGSIDLTVNSGTNPYNYTWSNGAIVEDISNLSMGYYNITVSDNAGCASYASIYIDDLSTTNNPISTLSNIPQDTCLQFNYDSVYVYAVYVINTTTVNVVWAFLQTSNGTIAYLSEVYLISGQGYYTVSITVTCGQKATYTYNDLIYIDYNNILVNVDDNKQILNPTEIYPNPFNDIININITAFKDDKIKLTLINMLGQVIFENIYNVSAGLNNIQINSEKLISGIYFIKIYSGNNNILNRKIVK